MSRSIKLLFLLALIGVAPLAGAATDPGFLLTATAKDFGTYFPGQLANGYLSTFTSPRGTETNLSYLIALMDYGRDDIARPAAIPGWSGTDYRADANGAWLNLAPLDASTFQDYSQVLDLHDATLTTRYRYIDHDKATRVEVVAFTSEASPHLAVVRFTVTPEFTGTIELSFPLVLWAPYQPRLPLAKLPGDTGLAGDRFRQALHAHGLSLTPLPPATADRAAIWYHGDTRVLDAEGDTSNLTLQLDGQATNGARMGEAVAVQLPDGVRPVEAKLDRTDNRLSLGLRVAVQQGHTYAFTKYVAVSRDGWGADARADLALAESARAHGFDAMLDAQRAAWAKLWRSDIRIDGDPHAQRAVHSDLYYLLANAPPDVTWGVGACALTTGYVGHVFWDSDSWIFPALLLLHPQRARSIVMFRDRTLPAAQQRAREAGFAGAKYPWEADPDNGSEQIMFAAHRLSVGEIHVNADIAIAQWQYWLATRDLDWLRKNGWPVIREVANFWASRASYDKARQRYEIRDVVSVMEPYPHVDDDTFTNASAAKALRIAAEAAKTVGAQPDPRWIEIADKLDIPFSASGQHHLDFAPGTPLHDPGDNDLAFLMFPSLDLAMDATTRRNDYRIAAAPLEQPGATATSMGLAPLTIAAATTGDATGAARWLADNISGDMMKPPFNVRTETPDNNTGWFLTGSAGFVQSLVYGFTGLRIEDAGLVQAYPPVLPSRWKSLTLTNLNFRGKHFDITIDRDASGKPRLQRTPASEKEAP
ncbi:MAG: Maltose phosphorylase / Trehalose phosphorylase [Rhodanobacteraceae bacterium]|jgi:trehalose/maltose hydrolase-like predicted phosphorylase|nr:MAG: Maltose phosphorylase / Trehalose phosphorylase [Rhodanobacteraceae bacterium]